MSYKVRVPKLMQCLIEAEDVTEMYKDPVSFIDEQSDSIKYLYKNFIVPIIKNNAVSISGLDMTKFEREDLETLWELYQNRIGPDSIDWRNLRKLYLTCKDSEPETFAVSYI